jgi:hypothetical protein
MPGENRRSDASPYQVWQHPVEDREWRSFARKGVGCRAARPQYARAIGEESAVVKKMLDDRSRDGKWLVKAAGRRRSTALLMRRLSLKKAVDCAGGLRPAHL